MISVAIPTVKRAHYLRIGLQSIFNQTMPPGEIVITDDGKDPATREVIQSFRATHPAVIVKHCVNEKPLGERANRQKAFRMTTGEFVTMLDDDDMWHPEFLEKAYRGLMQNPECGFCFGQYLMIDSDGNPLPAMTRDVDEYCGRSRMAAGKYEDVLHQILSYEALPFPLSCTLFRRKALEKIGFIPAFGDTLPDLALFMELGALRTSGYLIAERLGWYRVHSGQSTAWRVPNAISKVECFDEIYRKYQKGLSDKESTLLKRRYQAAVVECAISYLHDRKRKEALLYLSRFFKHGFGFPSVPRVVVFLSLLVGIRNRALSFFRDPTPKLRSDHR